MIPSHWLRKFILMLFLMGLGAIMLWVTGLVADHLNRPTAQATASVIFLFLFYASAPLTARFLAPRPSRDLELQKRLEQIIDTLPACHPVTLHDHAVPEANSVGLLPRWSRIYITTGLLVSMSDEGLRGVLAHEGTHIREHHILATFLYASGFAVSSQLLADGNFFLVALLLFLGLRRYSEYRADAGAVLVAGGDTTLIMLRELSRSYPSKAWHRWFSFASVYPTLAMRIRAIETGRMSLL
jgi:Zn-dependent protease with chaperone function